MASWSSRARTSSAWSMPCHRDRPAVADTGAWRPASPLSDAAPSRGRIPPLARAARWLLGEEVRVRGDWSVARPRLAPGGWAFEFANVNYPDVDDTAEVVLALRRTIPRAAAPRRSSARRAGWRGCRAPAGGWGAFDAENTRALVRELPFLDFGEVIDEPSADVTAHALEMLAALGLAGTPVARDGPALAARAAGARRVVVRALGGQLHVWHRRGGARAGGGRRGALRAVRVPCRGVAARASERGWRLGRGSALLRRPLRLDRPRPLDRLADRVGAAGAARRGRAGPAPCSAGCAG